MTNNTSLYNTINDNNLDEIKTEQLLEQYKLYVESAQKISDNRISTVNFMLVLLSSLIVIITAFLDDKTTALALCVIGIVICIYSTIMVWQFRKLNSIKFAVINELEQKMPLRLYCYEWELMGKKRRYIGLARMEIGLFIIIGLVFLIILLKVLSV